MYLEGRVVDADDARVPVVDRGFLYGDSVYEVVRTYGGVPFALAEHLERLARSAAQLDIGLPGGVPGIAAAVQATLAAAANDESYVRIIVTRGTGPIHLDPATAEAPRLYVIVTPLALLPPAVYVEGAAIRLVPTGHGGGSALAVGAKSGNYLTNVLALGAARRQGALEAVLLDDHGDVMEGASSNLFAVVGREVRTPPLTAGILAGITRGHLLALAAAAGYGALEVEIGAAALPRADEIFITSTLREVVPVTRVDDWTVGSGRPGPVTLDLLERYRVEVRAHCGAGGRS